MKPVIKSINNFEPWYKSHPYLLAAGILAAVAIVVGVSLSLPRHKEVQISPEEQARIDSAALHVALLPVHDCLPFYLAERCGLYERLGLDLRITTYQAQLDTDTALAFGHAEVAYSDIARAIMLQQDSIDVRAIAALPGELQLITPRRGRVRKLNQLHEKMVAVSRHSITDYWSDRLTDSAGMARSDIFRPQINDLRIRTDMVCNNTMDAAFLPEPFASEALIVAGNRNLSTRGLTPQLVVLLARREALADPVRRRQIGLLQQGYDQAVALADSLPALRDSLAVILRSLCLTPDTLVDSLLRRLPRFQPLAPPRQTDVEAAMSWLRSRDKIKKGYKPDSLITE